MPSLYDLESLMPKISAIAGEAGNAIMDIYAQTDLGTTYKADDSPLTRADMVSHHLILNALQTLEPQLPVLSEESKSLPYEERQQWSAFWLVDPIDGTKEFIKRNGEFTVNIALVVNGVPELGVVHAPALHTTYSAAQGIGAFKKTAEKDPVTICTTGEQHHPGTGLKVVASRSHAGPETESFLASLKQSVGDIETLSVGSSLKLCLVAEGAAQLYPRFGPTMEWDTAAAQCVVEQAGGSVSNLQGQRLHYNKPNLLNPYFMVCGVSALSWQDHVKSD